MSADITPDLDQLIVHAVNARIEAEVTKALSGDEVIGKLVSAALQQPIESRDFMARGQQKKTFLTVVLEKAIQEATKKAVAKILAERVEDIEIAVERALMGNLAGLADQLVKGLSERAAQAYGVDVKVDLRMPRSD